MEFLNINPTTTAAWQELIKHAEETKNFDIKEAFKNNPERAKEFHIRWNDFFVDFSKNKINENTINLLQKLAKETELSKGIEAYFGGEKINKTEKREVLHTALRDFSGEKILVNGKNVMPEVTKAKNKIKAFSNAIIKGTKKGYTNKKFTDVVNIGIGGSDLGPAMVVESLMYYKNNLNVHFVSNVDGDHVQEILKKINPETTLFVIVSKTFTTQETLTNAETIRNWFLKSATQLDVAQHFVAVSTNSKKVTEFGIAAENIFPMWDWVGGRFSLWSAVGLSISLAVGFSNFEKLLKGAYEMDMHFKNTALEENIPVTLALLSIWYNNFLNAETEVLIPYSQYLQKLAPYLQQGIMESNGKSIDRNGKPVNYQTGTVIWGEPGTNSQHAFFQLIHQGTKLIPADFIGFKKSLHGNQDHHNKLMSNFFAQTEALLQGKTEAEVIEEFKAKGIAEEEYKALVPFKVFNGNKPTTTLLIDQLTPETLGSLIALYEHKIFVQGYIWNIFSYDQWGVELGKQLASSILTEIETKSVNKHDASTIQLLNEFLM
jgi:glucose-6-phosphate isomerase